MYNANIPPNSMLTDRQVKALLAKPGRHRIDRRLYLHVRDSGAASWLFRYLGADGRSHAVGMGPYPEVTLAEARTRAVEWNRRRLRGEDPLQAKRFAQEKSAGKHCFRQVAEDLIAAKRSGWSNQKHAQQWRATLQRYAYPVLGDMDVAAIGVEHVLRVLRPIWDEKPETASRVRQRIEAVLDAAAARSLRSGDNPARWRGCLQALLPAVDKTRRVRHFPALPYQQLPEFWQALQAQEGMAARCLQFVILTACRSGEARGARWSEVDFERALWIVPAERMKARREHVVPLSDAALALLRSLPRIAGTEFVFPSATGRALSDMALTALLRRMNEAGPKRWIDRSGEAATAHGFRSSFRDWAGEATHHPREVIEHALAHRIPDKAEAAYARGSLLEKRRRLMQNWARYITEGARVLAFKRSEASRESAQAA